MSDRDSAASNEGNEYEGQAQPEQQGAEGTPIFIGPNTPVFIGPGTPVFIGSTFPLPTIPSAPETTTPNIPIQTSFGIRIIGPNVPLQFPTYIPATIPQSSAVQPLTMMPVTIGSNISYTDTVFQQCAKFSNESGIAVSPYAQFLIRSILGAVLQDPHPRWKAEDQERGQVVQTFLTELAKHLYDIAQSEHVEGVITTFDILHWLAINLDGLCIIQK